MAKATFKTQEGKSVADGSAVTLDLAYSYETVSVTGTVRAFDHVERVYDEEGIAVGKTSEQRWEILTGDPAYPAVGFLPENVIRAS